MAPVIYKRQRDLLEFVSQFMQKHGYAPTLAEICDGLGLRSPATVHEHIQNLMEKGVLKRTEGVRRGIEVIDQTASVMVPPDMVGAKRCFVLLVKGSSMIEAAILDGDFVVVEETPTATNGDIVVALLNDSFATLKRFYQEVDHVRLEPANSTMNPILTRNVQIKGKVVGVIRQYH